ncbi:MAG TPA: FtsX-like permease family protein [Ktedonobacterales bacterium]|nr:FtsX-like permease family protein [Ktedonobacterales bacterium]
MLQTSEHIARASGKSQVRSQVAPSLLARMGNPSVGPTTRGVRNVVRSPVRLALVAAILGISLMFVAVMVALNASAQQRLDAAQAQIGTGITISPAGSGGFGGGNSDSGSTAQTYISADQLTTIKNTAGVTSISEYVTTRDRGGSIKGAQKIPTDLPTFIGNAGATTGTGNGAANGAGSPFGGGVDGTIPPSIEGLLPSSQLTLANGVALTLKSGRTFTNADATANVAITSAALASANGYTLGSTFSLNGTTVTLVGLYTASDPSNENTIIVPFQTAQKIYGISGATGVTAYADSVSDVDAVASRLRKALGTSLDVVAQSQIYTDTINTLHTTESTIATTLAISALVAALVIVFAVFLIVRERTQEIGLLRAIGASTGQIVHQFAVETLALGVAAAVVATALIALFAGTIARQFTASPTGTRAGGSGRIFTAGAGGFTPPAGGFAQFGNAASRTLSAGLTPGTVLLVFALGIGLAILASVIPAWYVTRVRPATALRTAG